MVNSIVAHLQKPRLINILRGVSRPAVYTPMLAPESKWARHSTVLVWEEREKERNIGTEVSPGYTGEQGGGDYRAEVSIS